MNLPFKDGGNERKREEALARRMGQALDRLASRDAADCPDAEVLAAYHDQALEPDEVLRCEEHFAGCARCRKILAVLAASDDTPLAETEVARLGELIAAAQAPRAAESLRPASPVPIRSAWKTRWLA
ncbi:MAG: zf-HC2 domain-containing protein, partial [Bryobacteraceae bacterium]